MNNTAKIIITGSEGFIGQELVRECLKTGITPRGTDLSKKSPENYEFYPMDLASPSVSDIIPENLETLIHLAGVMIIRDPSGSTGADSCFDINVFNTLNLARAALARKVNHIIFASTEWVYGESGTDQESLEDEIIDIAKLPTEYALSKAVSEANLRQFHALGVPNITILRFSIVYGPSKEKSSAVNSLFNKIKNDEPIEVGSLQTGRRFIHVNDIAQGILAAVRKPSGFSIFNLSYDNVITLGDIIKTSEKLLGKTAIVQETSPLNISVRNPSNAKAKRELVWQPMMDLESGLMTLA